MKRGISLIVLVITIIVIIILAAAIILSLNNAGIIGNANKAVDDSNIANIKTAADLAYAEYLIDSSSLSAGANLGERITNTLIANETITGDDYVVGLYDDETVVAKSGTVAFEYYKGNINIGDYVNYDPTYKVENVSEIKYTSLVANNGWADQLFALKDGEDQSYDNEKYGWQVMGIDKDGRLLLLSEDYIQAINGGHEVNNKKLFGLISQNSSAPYIKGLQELENICDLYGHGYGAVDARCITLEDVNRITGYNPDKAIKKYNQGNMSEYKNKVDIYWYNEEGTTKVLAEGSNGVSSTLGEVFYYYDNNNEYKEMTKPTNLKVGEKVKIMTVINNHYTYFAETLTSNVSDKEIGKVCEGTAAYDLLFKDGDGNLNNNSYFLANKNIAVGTQCLAYMIAGVQNNQVRGFIHKKSDGSVNGSWQGIRPVITLDENIKLSGNSTDGFSIVE